jgi:PAS domain S-box-containing protein
MPGTNPESPATYAKMLKLLDHLPNGVVGLAESGEVLFVNHSLKRFLGYTGDELTGRPIFTLDPYLNLFTWKKIWKQLATEGSYYSTSLFMRADGHVVPVKVRAVFETGFATDLVLFFIEDELAARSTSDLLAVLSQNAQVGAWEYNLLTGRITLAGVANEWTDAPEDTLRSHPRAQLYGLLDRWVVPEEKRRLLAAIGRAIAEQTGFSYTFPWELTNGETLRLCVEGKCEVDEQGVVTKVYGAAWDEKQQARENGELAFLGQFSIEHANDYIFWVRENGSFAYVNQSACQRLGYTWEEFQEIDVTTINTRPPAERPGLWEQLRQKKSLVIETELRSKAGERVPVSAALNYIVYEGEAYNCVFCRDLSEQRERREQLLRTRFTLSNINEAVVWVNDRGQIEYANEYFSKLAQVALEKLLNAPVRDLFTVPEGRASVPDFWSWLRQTDDEEWEGDLILPDDKRIPVYGTLSQLVDGDRSLFCLFLRDWQRKKARDRQLQLAQQSMMASRDLVLWIDESYGIEFANNTAQQTLQQYRSRYLGTPLNEFLHDPASLNEVILRSSGVVEFKTDGATLIPVEFRCSKIEAGKTVMYSLIGRDVTERRRREEELMQTKEELERMSSQLQQENLLLREEINTAHDFNNIITRSKEYRQKVLSKVAQVASSDATVLILGETGTGKELLARAIHSMSNRDEQALIKVNCAALPPSLIESELFGHEKGAFTGAHGRKNGRFELADGGTLFLDEAGEMPLDLQAKMLRVLQEGEFERVGGTTTIKVDVRIIAATNRNLEQMVAEGKFREDLYYRLNVFPIFNMPLRERREDIPLLVRHFANKYSERLKRNIEEIPAADLELLARHDFPGNIRELENMVERAVILSSGKLLNLRAGMTFEVGGNGGPEPASDTRILPFEEMQRRHILAALKQTEGRVTGPEGAARLLQLNDRTLASKMRKLGIKRDDYLRKKS